MSDAKLIADALRTLGGKAYDTYTGPASTLLVWAEFRRLADIIDRKLAEREAGGWDAWGEALRRARDKVSRGRESGQAAATSTKADVPVPGSHPDSSTLDELRAKYEAEIEVEGYLVAAHNFIVALEAKVKRLQYRGGMRKAEIIIALGIVLVLAGCTPARAEDRPWRDYAAEHRAWNKAQAETVHQNHAETQRLLRPEGAGMVPPYYLPSPPPVRRLDPGMYDARPRR